VPVPDVEPRRYRNMAGLVFRCPVLLVVLALIAFGPGLPDGLSAGERARPSELARGPARRPVRLGRAG
jgi:hypothetical protein